MAGVAGVHTVVIGRRCTPAGSNRPFSTDRTQATMSFPRIDHPEFAEFIRRFYGASKPEAKPLESERLEFTSGDAVPATPGENRSAVRRRPWAHARVPIGDRICTMSGVRSADVPKAIERTHGAASAGLPTSANGTQ